LSGVQKRQAGRQDRIGNIHIVGPGLRPALTARPGKVRQTVHGVGFLSSQRVRIEAHGQVDVAVPHYFLCNRPSSAAFAALTIAMPAKNFFISCCQNRYPLQGVIRDDLHARMEFTVWTRARKTCHY
jgi:hypothetical protein